MEILEGSEDLKSSHKFTCENCNFKCCKKSLYERHLLTLKHIVSHNGNELEGSEMLKSTKGTYICKCKKIYTTNSGLWKHKKICTFIKDLENPNVSLVPDNLMNLNVIYELIKQNNEFKSLLVEQNNKIMELAKDKSITNNNTINNNHKFNMNFFLNDQCKDALDIMEFVNSLQLNISDLENTGKVGYIKGISDIFLRGLRELDVYKRPIHCSDIKREVMYVKDNDVWEKDEDKTKVKKAIQHVAGRNFKQIKEWVEMNPDSRDVKTKKHDQYVSILSKCTGGIDSEEDNHMYNKIITNVAKEVIIER